MAVSRHRRRWSQAFVGLAFALLSWNAGSSTAEYDGPPLSAHYSGAVLVANSQLRYTGPDRLEFSTSRWLEEFEPHLRPYAGVIDTWASRLSLHPRLLSHLLAADFDLNPDRSRRANVDQIVRVATALASLFDPDSEDDLSATRAVIATADALGLTDWWPHAEFAQKRPDIAGGDPAPLFGFFQPPWEIGETWAGGGAHGGNGSGKQNALDFWGSYRGWGEDLSEFWVAAMQAGTVRVWSTCGMAIVHGNGWVTDYYHLDNIQVADGATVQRNDRIAHYADNVDQALCSGGSSSGPHVHMSLSFNGSRVLVNEDQVDFTAFSHHIGEGQYDSNCDRSYYTHTTAGTVCPNYDRLLNNAPPVATGPIFRNGFED